MSRSERHQRHVDLLSAIDGVSLDECFAHLESVEVAGERLDIIALEDFQTNKRARGRLKDLADLESLEPPADPGPGTRHPNPST